MEKAEIRQYLNQIVGNIASISSEVKGLGYQDFHENDQARETVYSYLQEIGQAAHELNLATDEVMDEDFSLGALASLRNARYNQEAEMADQNIWALVETDLPEIAEEIEQSELYARN